MLSQVSAGGHRSAKHHVQGVDVPVAVAPGGSELRRHSVCGPASVSAVPKSPPRASINGLVDFPALESRAAQNYEDRAELPILRGHYVARGVRVLCGSRWKLNRFQDRTVVLRTGAKPTLAVYAVDAIPSSFDPSNAVGTQPETTCELEISTNCELSGSFGSMEMELSSSKRQFRLRIRFTTAADASIWCSVVRETLAHAKWSRGVRPLKQGRLLRERDIRVVQDVQSTERFVVKVLSTDREQGDCHELEILRRLSTSWAAREVGLVRRYRVVQTPQELLLIMPQLEGTTLLQLLRQRRRQGHKRLESTDAWKLLALIVEALQAVHRSGIVHCDLNLENVLVSSDLSCAWLIDYGGAYDLLNTNSSRQDRQMTGTPGYVAPERVQDPSAPPTPQADVFSLGVILFQTLTGQHPYSDNSHKKTPVQLSDSLRLDWNRAEALLLAKAVPSALRELVGKMLLPDPKTRIPLREVIAASSCGLAAIARKI